MKPLTTSWSVERTYCGFSQAAPQIFQVILHLEINMVKLLLEGKSEFYHGLLWMMLCGFKIDRYPYILCIEAFHHGTPLHMRPSIDILIGF